MVTHAEQRPRPQQPPRAHGRFDGLAFGSLKGVFVREDALVRRLAPGRLLGFKAKSCGVLYGAWRSGPSGGSMSRIRRREPLLRRTSPSGLQGKTGLPSGGRTAPACSA